MFMLSMTRQAVATASRNLRNLIAALAVFGSCLCDTAVAAPGGEPWILVDVKHQTLSVIHNGEVQVRFYDISIGRGGAGLLRTVGDAKTPIGEFRVGWVNQDSRYRLFFGLDFPNLEYATRAYESQLIDSSDYYAIRTAVLEGRTPPQNTRLGGNIGIHGVGREGNRGIHQSFNWTDGCVALTDEQVEVLAQWVGIGTKVIIH